MYDRWADTIDRSAWAPWCNRWGAGFAQEIPEGSAILDVGCGTGSALLILSARHPTRLSGIDISPRAVAVARSKLAGLNADLHFLSRRGLRRLLARGGFRTIAQKRAAFLARYAVAQKRSAGPEQT